MAIFLVAAVLTSLFITPLTKLTYLLMFKPLKIIIVLISIFFSAVSHAENMLFDANILYTIPNAGGSDDFHTGKIISINYNHYYLPWLAFTGGLFASEEIADNTKTDIVGTYQVNLETRGLTLGLRPEYKFSDRNKIFSRIGLLYYDTSLRVEEFFSPGKISGSNTESTTGNGFFIAIGWSHSLTKKLSFQLELSSQKQLELFAGKASAEGVFDLTNSGFSLGLSYDF